MRVLFLTQVVAYPLDAGPKVRAYYVLRQLAAAGHDVTLVTFTRDTDRPDDLAHLRSLCQEVRTVPMVRSARREALAFARSLPTPEPFLIARDRVPALTKLLAALVGRRPPFDVVHADQLWMAPYALGAASAGAGARPRTVLDQHNAVFQVPLRLAVAERGLARRLALRLEAVKLKRFERRTCGRFDHVVWVTGEDRAALFGAAPVRAPERESVIPICVDPAAAPVVDRDPAGRRVTFLGGLHWPPNAAGIGWFAREAWPRVRAAVPDARLTVVGRRPPDDLLSLAAADPTIEVAGYVDDPRPLLAQTAAFVVPLRAGGGMRVKILDAWRWGLPVVTTTIGAEGLVARDGDNALVADTAEALADAVVRLLGAPNLASRLAASGRRTVEAHYDWRRVYPAWDRAWCPSAP